jgi:hypothetical protein
VLTRQGEFRFSGDVDECAKLESVIHDAMKQMPPIFINGEKREWPIRLHPPPPLTAGGYVRMFAQSVIDERKRSVKRNAQKGADSCDDPPLDATGGGGMDASALALPATGGGVDLAGAALTDDQLFGRGSKRRLAALDDVSPTMMNLNRAVVRKLVLEMWPGESYMTASAPIC